MEIKKCGKCKSIKSVDEFGIDNNRKNGLKLYCKVCRKNESDKEKDKKRKQEWYKNNKNLTIKRAKDWAKNNNIRRNEIAISFYRRDKTENPHLYAWRAVLNNTIVRIGDKKQGKTIDLLGYSAIELKNYITSLFTDGMSWDNHGEWHIDHVKPITSFDKETLINTVNALTNLQPLWATTRKVNGVIYEGNLNKYNKIYENKNN